MQPKKLYRLSSKAKRGILKKKIPERSITWVYPCVHRGKLNFHDALIALVSKETGINYIVSFDKDFDEIVWLKRINGETIE